MDPLSIIEERRESQETAKRRRATVGRREKEVRFEGLGALPRKGDGPGVVLASQKAPWANV